MTDISKPNQIQRIGKQVKLLRLKAGYTSYETFATDHHLPRKTYWRVEAGHNFTIETLIRILDIHGMTLKKFFEELE